MTSHQSNAVVHLVKHSSNVKGAHSCSVLKDGKIVDGVDDMRKAVRQEIKYGSDWIKVRH